MDADDKENISGYDLVALPTSMEGDQNKSRAAGEGANPPGVLKREGELAQPVDLTTEKAKGVVGDHVRSKDGDRWIKASLAPGNHSDEEEVFFGDVTNKEIKKTKKFNSRKTAVFVPGFRRDRRLMRYTMVPPTLTSVGENEEIGEIEGQTNQGKEVDFDRPSLDSGPDVENNMGNSNESTLKEITEDEECVKTGKETGEENSKKIETEGVSQDILTKKNGVDGNGEHGTGNGEVCTANVEGAEGKELVPCRAIAIPEADDDSSPEMDSLITEVVNESLHEEHDQVPNCDSLLYYCQPNVPVQPPAPFQPPATAESDSESETSDEDEDSSDEEEDSDDDDDEEKDDKDDHGKEKNSDTTVACKEDINNSNDSSEDEYVPTDEDKENLNLMLRALDNRTAFLNVLSRMNRPGGNANTKGKPEAFEALLKSSKTKCPESDDSTDEKKEDIDQVKEKNDEESEKSSGKDCEALSRQFETLGIQPGDAMRGGDTPETDSDPSTPKEDVKDPLLSSKELESDDSKSTSASAEQPDNLISTEIKITKSENDLQEDGPDKMKETVSELVEENESLPQEPTEDLACLPAFSNRNNCNSNDSDTSLDKVAEDISQLRLGSLPQVDLSDGKEILPNLSDDNALAIETIVARAADNEELASALPELDVDDIIDILLEEATCEVTSEEPDVSAGFMVEQAPRRICGDNTVVVASNNRIGSPSGGAMYPSLPEIPTRIGATHTVTSVLGPISSPSSVRCERRYRSIYATLPNDSIEIETQVVPEHEPEKDLLSSFGKLDLGESQSPKCQLNDSLLTGTQMCVPVDSPGSKLPQETDKLSEMFSSPEQKPAFPTASSPLLNERSPVERPVELDFAVAQSDSPKPAGFSPSVVFTEKNFSPILEVKFPDSPPSVEVPKGLKCTHLTSSCPTTYTCSSHSVPRDNKRKQPSGEEPLSNSLPSSTGHKSAPRVKTTPTKNKVLRTPPKKVIGQPNVHRFHAAFGKNPASRSLFYKNSIHVSPKTTSKSMPRTPAARQRSRSKSPVSARKPVAGKPPVSSRTPNPTRSGSNSTRSTPAQTKTPGSTRTPGPYRSFSSSSASSRGTPGSVNIQSGRKYTPAKPKQPPSSSTPHSLSSASSRKISKPNSHNTNSATNRVTPMKSLFSRPSPSNRFHGTPLRQTPATPCSLEKTPRAIIGHRPTPGRPKGTPQRIIDGEVCTSPMFLTPASRTPHSAGRLGGSSRKPTPYHKGASEPRAGDRDPSLDIEAEDPLQPDHPPVFSKGTPRYLVDDAGDHGAEDTQDIYDEPPPVFDLDDLEDIPQGEGGSRESSPRLSMEDVLERKRQQMMNLRAEKRKIQDIISKQGCPSVKSPRANNTVTADSLPKQRLANTQTLSLSDKELEAVTQLHTLCNSQRTVKVIHKGRAMLIRQLPQSPHIPRRLSWNQNLVLEIEEDDPADPDPSPPEGAEASPTGSGASSPEVFTPPPKPILHKKESNFVYPFDNETPPPVVVFRGRGSERHHAKRSPRID